MKSNRSMWLLIKWGKNKQKQKQKQKQTKTKTNKNKKQKYQTAVTIFKIQSKKMVETQNWYSW